MHELSPADPQDQHWMRAESEVPSVKIESATVDDCKSPRQSPDIKSSYTNHHCIFDRFYLIAADGPFTSVNASRFEYFDMEPWVSYVGFCDDFGPMNLGMVHTFYQKVGEMFDKYPDRDLAMITSTDGQSLTNAVFLIGAYMILKLDMQPVDVWQSFKALSARLLSFRDVSPGQQNFHLHLEDCWAGLFKAKTLRWVDFGPEGFDASEYAQLDDPLNADLHEIVPGKFVAMRGPVDMPGGTTFQDILTPAKTFSHRDFGPAHYVDILEQFDVQVVVRLNTPTYRKQVFVEGGIAVAELYFEDCTTPPLDVVAKFMMLAEGLPGAVAVHCKAGLGRTGTLIALYMMKHHGFSAREAIGWIRIVRPGSIIGPQQQFLCDQEDLMRRAGEKFRQQTPPQVLATRDVAAVQDYVERVQHHVDCNISRILAARSAPGSPAPQPATSMLAAGQGTQSTRTVEPSRPPGGAAVGAERLAAHVSAVTDRRNGMRASSSLQNLTSA